MDQDRPRFELSPGMTACCDCGTVISTPANKVPASFLAAHIGHTIATTLALTVAEPTEDQYICAQCHKVFDKARSDDDALADARAMFGEIPPQEQATICDDCHRILMARFN